MATGAPATAEEVIGLLERVHDVCGRLEPDNVPLHAAPQVFDALTSLERLASGAVLRMAGRYEEAGAWKRNGSKSAEDDIARKTGSPTGAARRKLSTSRRLRRQQRTDEAVRNGDLSAEQANEVSSGADASPEDEEELLDTARRQRLSELRKRAADARAKADRDREARRRRQQALRGVRRWTDDDGMGNLLVKLPPEQMAEVDAALKPRIDRAFADARQAGRFEPVERYAADVIRDLLVGGGGDAPAGRRSQAVRPDKKVIALIDLAALNRGSVEGDETCEIAGVGPVSVSAVRALLHDAFLAVVIKDGIDIRHVTHLGRQVTAAQRTALEARSGGACEVCRSRHLLDIDHNEGWTLTHDTCLDDVHPRRLTQDRRHRRTSPAPATRPTARADELGGVTPQPHGRTGDDLWVSMIRRWVWAPRRACTSSTGRFSMSLQGESCSSGTGKSGAQHLGPGGAALRRRADDDVAGSQPEAVPTGAVGHEVAVVGGVGQDGRRRRRGRLMPTVQGRASRQILRHVEPSWAEKPRELYGSP